MKANSRHAVGGLRVPVFASVQFRFELSVASSQRTVTSAVARSARCSPPSHPDTKAKSRSPAEMHRVIKPWRCTTLNNRGDAPRHQTVEMHHVKKPRRFTASTNTQAVRHSPAEMHRVNKPWRCTTSPNRGDAPRHQTVEMHHVTKPRRFTASANTHAKRHRPAEMHRVNKPWR